MGQFWDSATRQAGREFGARHYRWFAGARVARVIGPPLLVVAVLAGFVAAAVAGYRAVDPNWSAISSNTLGWLAHAIAAVGSAVLWIAVAAAALAVAAAVVLWVRRHWWSFSLNRPMWMRRY
jgi:hypothetical protein